MRAMVLHRIGEASRPGGPPHPRPRPRPGACARRRLRGLPHRPARGRWRTCRPPAPRSSPGTRSSAASMRLGRGVERFRPGDRVGVPWLAGPAANARTAAPGARTSVRTRASPAARSTAAIAEYAVADARYCFAIPDGFSDVARRAADVRRADRLSHAAHGRRRSPARHLRLRRRRPHRRPGGALGGPRGVRLHPPRRHRRPGLRPPSGRGLGRRIRRAAARAAGRRADLRPGGRAGAGGAAGDRARAAPWSAAAST